MEELKKREKELGFKLLLIDGKGMLNKTLEVIADKAVTIPVLIDGREYAREHLNVMYTPTTLIIDEEGKLRSHLVGGARGFEDIVSGILNRI
ncbi:MAG: hypothetical protein JXB45_04505 [Candidatus Krumholzibacteriota bacterium]|nr:hypothetical protein [Candidatus Krumholzibacteriota bacterium]